ncbi:MAG TPA: membrane-bound PQQ-dependent dehydrogenase, glucose/quinate/shikimate family [Woeseiaceae bacterium]|nr:membrane-bound PQQ-dependent dehydrogenase, glucose/quinate/shikimate family [Woeseiaceae bacterium]
MAEPEEENGTERHWLLWIFGAFLALFGLAMAGGGLWLVTLGGSWYYLLAGIGLIVAGIELMRGRIAGAWWYAAVFIGTLLWTVWEAGLDYWRWIPRFGLIVIFAFILALLLPRLKAGPSTTVARSLAVLFALIFIGVFALAFLPHGITEADWSRASPVSETAEYPFTGDAFGQPANAPADGDWAAYGRSNSAMRFSPLTQIDTGNVDTLARAWVYRTGDLPDRRWGAETTPIEIGGTMYLCSARNIMIALDAASGEELWRYDPGVEDASIPYTAACRGVTYYEVPAAAAAAPAAAGACGTRIFEGTLDGRLIAVSAATGEPCPGFGENGQVDIKRGMGRTRPGMVSITSPPVVVRGVLVTGHQVLDGQRRNAPSGVIQGFDAVTGALRWAWDLAKPQLERRPPAGETYTRGTPNMWTIASSDAALGLVYLPMGNSAVDYWSGSRSGRENEFSTSLVALDVTTGEPAWHFQTVHADVWDYDLGSTATLVDFPTANGVVPAIVLPSKQGDIYVLDRRTGEPITGVEERPVPQGGVEPEQRTATQPYSLYHSLQQPPLSARDMWGISPLDQLFCRIQFERSVYQGMYTPPTAETHYLQYSGYNGGSDWGGIAIDPERGVIVANYNDMPNHNRLVPRAEAEAAGYAPRDQQGKGEPGGAEGAGDPQIGAPYAIDVNAGWRVPVTKLLCKEPPYGGIRVIDLATGNTIWDRPLGLARSNGPFGIPSKLPILIGTPNNGGSAVTASGLIFIAAATDDLIRAIDLETGELLWKDVLPAGGQAGPMVYEAGGREYLVIMAGGHHFMETPVGDYVIAYALPE